MKTPFYYVSIAGVLGSGKSTACNLLAQKLGFHVFQEKAEENIFLPLFYEDLRRWAFHAQMFYLHEKAAQLREIKNLLATTHVVQDAPIYQDKFTYAEAQRRLGNMSSEEFELYQKSFDSLAPELPEPHLIVNLDASPKTILERIRRRGREYEKNVDANYVKLLSELQRDWISKNKNLAILNFDTDELDLAHNTDHQKEFISKIGNRLGISGTILA